MITLPRIMVAPNGARRTKKDHPALPMTIAELVEAAVECEKVGAGGIHIHVRDGVGRHVLDAGLYREALTELAKSVPGMVHQITTEAVGKYSPAEQRAVITDVQPESASISIAEMSADADPKAVSDFYRWCRDADIAVQHIVYGEDDLRQLQRLLDRQVLIPDGLQLLFVLGRYAKNQQSRPADLHPFTNWLSSSGLRPDWAVCAFGRGETECLVAAAKLGGKVRVGFENSLWNSDGSVAVSNAARVAEVYGAMSELAGMRSV